MHGKRAPVHWQPPTLPALYFAQQIAGLITCGNQAMPTEFHTPLTTLTLSWAIVSHVLFTCWRPKQNISSSWTDSCLPQSLLC